MKTDKEIAYQNFWNNLKHAYPISNGDIRLPIARDLIEIPDLDHKELQDQLRVVLDQLLQNDEIKATANKRAEDAGDNDLIPLINDDYTGVVRFDCLWNPNTSRVSILEINCDYPDGLLLHDKTYSALADRSTNEHKFNLNKLFGDEETVVLHSDDAFFLDAYAVESQNLKSLGNNGKRITDLSEATEGSVVRRCLETSKMTSDMFDHFRTKRLKPINTMALRTLGYKDLLQEIDHPYVLKTTKVTTDIIDYCNQHKDDLVLKPIDGCEGFNIYFGHKLNQVEWSKLISKLSNTNYIVQELAHIPQMKVSLYDEGTVIDKVLYYDLCPHFFIKSGEVIGSGHTLMRFSENPIVNVSQGGGIGYYKL
tara:strand:- start:140 stop:1237 length:1098 start_codon:yes stop_codon:yes gene_type:complete